MFADCLDSARLLKEYQDESRAKRARRPIMQAQTEWRDERELNCIVSFVEVFAGSQPDLIKGDLKHAGIRMSLARDVAL